MRALSGATALLAATAAVCAAQGFQFDFGRLAQKAKESVDVNLDGAALQFASRFLSDKSPDEAKAKKLVEGLTGIYVKSFEFAKPGEYTAADVEALRAQVRGPQWSRIVGVRSEAAGENTDVFLKTEASRISGLAIIAAEPTQLTVVNIVGPIDPDALSDLGGRFGIPKLEQAKPKK